jgi:malate synthase
MKDPRYSYDISGPIRPGYEQVLSPEALEFVANLADKFTSRVSNLLQQRQDVQARLDAGEKLDFLSETTDIRNSQWSVASLPKDLQDRRVEITGPVDRKMIINALNSDANCFMADFEDATSPTWDNLVQGQINLFDAVRGVIRYEDPDSGKQYKLNKNPATLLVRPRGLHLPEKHMRVYDEYIPGALFDFGLYFFHNARVLLSRGSGPYFYLPKLESYQEARLWNDIFVHAQRMLDIPRGSIKATVLIETLPAAFQMHEILFELREHSSGLNCGRWDYIFSMIKRLRNDPRHVLPDRQQVTMIQPCMRAYTQLVIQTCHQRNVHAIGGMAAQIPIRNDEAANQKALDKVCADKLREVMDGHDGTWVAHPGLISVAKEIFNLHMHEANQIDRKRTDINITDADLLQVPQGTRTEHGLRENVRVGIRYIEAWLNGHGAVPLNHLMEDAATAEISRAQIWQWLHHSVTLDDDETLTEDRLIQVMQEELNQIEQEIGHARFHEGHFDQAFQLFQQLCLAESFEEFLTLPAYEYLLENEPQDQETKNKMLGL